MLLRKGVLPVTAAFVGLARESFVGCAPPEGCVGGLNNTCSRTYTGERCSLCAKGAYRFGGSCKSCPDTAWLMFLFASVAILTLVALSVYLSKRKLNLAVLGIGMVSAL